MVLFRADGNSEIGTGHIMRCLSVADGFSDISVEAEFVCADDSMKALIEGRGYKCHVLGTDYRFPEAELPVLISSNLLDHSDLLIADSYFVTEKYFMEVSELTKVAYIDDYLTKFPVDCLINYSIYADEDEYKKLYADHEKTRFIIGTDYAPLRKMFAEKRSDDIRKEVKNVLVLTGGADMYHIAYRLAEFLTLTDEDKYDFHFVVGAMSPDFEKIMTLSAGSKHIHIHHNVKDMKSLMDSCDIAVSASGSTLYELCACGVPTINYYFADNQIAGAKGFSDRNIMKTLGDARGDDDFVKKMYAAISELSNDFSERKRMSESAFAVVDGKGALRLATVLKGLFSK